MAAYGASRPLRRTPAIVCFLNPQPALSLVGGNRSSCPEADTHDHPHERAKGQLTIRLQGIDAPELHYQPSALEAAEFPGLDKAVFAAKKKQYHDAKVVHPYRQLLGATTSKALHDRAGQGRIRSQEETIP